MGQGGSGKRYSNKSSNPLGRRHRDEETLATKPGRLYDLTTLQKEANRLHHLPASRTLQLAQALYEKHKAITYPHRFQSSPRRLRIHLQRNAWSNLRELASCPACPSVGLGGRKNKRIFNNKQISDHFAIIPTNTPRADSMQTSSKSTTLLSSDSYRLFILRLNGASPPARAHLERHAFKTEGRVLVEPSGCLFTERTINPRIASRLSPPMIKQSFFRRRGNAIRRDQALPATARRRSSPQWKAPENYR